jgi:[ribosomal protein S5]-alanine N-acetyltransferase
MQFFKPVSVVWPRKFRNRPQPVPGRKRLLRFCSEAKLQNDKIQQMIETERLILQPLTYDQLVKYSKGDNSLEEELNVNKTSRAISPALKEALEQTILPNVADTTRNYLYSTLWTAISKAENKMVGDLCIVGEPNPAGEIEIGYGVYDEFQHKGFMTEIVGGMIKWAKTQPPVQAIIASTDKTNIASFKVLQKNNFSKVGETDLLFHWKLAIKIEPIIG